MPTPEELAATQAQGEAARAAAVVPEFTLDPRFKSVEDQATAYKEAEKKMTQESQKRADLERQNQELLARQQQQATQAAPPPPPNYNELFWQNPAEVIERLVERQVAPFIEDRYELQKQKYVSDPNFNKYSVQIDQMVQFQPGLKQQPGIVDKLYRVVRAMEFNPDEERKRIEAEVTARLEGKTAGLVEGAGTPTGAAPTLPVVLSEDEKRTALKFHPELTPDAAYKLYGERKVKHQTGVY
jgi:hypothetical protein